MCSYERNSGQANTAARWTPHPDLIFPFPAKAGIHRRRILRLSSGWTKGWIAKPAPAAEPGTPRRKVLCLRVFAPLRLIVVLPRAVPKRDDQAAGDDQRAAVHNHCRNSM